VIASTCPACPVWGCEERLDFCLCEEGNQISLETLRWNRQDPFNHGRMLGMSKRCKAKQRADRSEPSVARPDAGFPTVLEVVEELGDESSVEMVHVEKRRLDV
jgi:hypothetical protein